MIRHRSIQAVAQKPEVIQPLRDDPHQLPFTGNVIQKQQQQQLHDNRGIHRLVPVITVAGSHLLPNPFPIQQRVDPAQGMVGAHAPLQIYVVTEQLFLRCLASHHGVSSPGWTNNARRLHLLEAIDDLGNTPLSLFRASNFGFRIWLWLRPSPPVGGAHLFR